MNSDRGFRKITKNLSTKFIRWGINMKKFYEKYLHNYVFLCLISSLFINLLIECCSRRSIAQGINYLIDSPLVFLYNSSIILFTFSILILVKRRIFFYSLITTVWSVFGVVNGVVLSKRVTPFTAIELKLLDSVLDIVDKYLTNWQIALILTALIAVGIALILAFIFAPKVKGKLNYKKNITLFVASVLSFFVITNVAIKTDVITTYFGNIADAYLDYGFPYCFSNTLVNTGISKPDNYSEEAVKSIFEQKSDNVSVLAKNDNNTSTATVTDNSTNNVQADVTSSTTNGKKPNVIFLQLESFFDPTHIKDVTFSEDPVPYYRYLKEHYSSGFLTVPVVGAGTVNTEFEVMTGMNLKYFGPGEYPYKTILKKKTCESAAYDLEKLGYSSHAIHNNKGTFYTRQNVFKNLGYDSFTSVEFMNNAQEKTTLGWAKDTCLTSNILDALNSTENPDYIYTISVEAHGEYPDDNREDHNVIKVSGLKDESQINSYEYYASEIKQVDNFIKELTDALSKYDEDTILVMYGDHLPSLGINNEDLDNGNIFQTEYVIWSNFDMPKEDKDLEAYQLTADVLGREGISTGTLFKYHQLYSDTDNYEKNLKLLQYDMLYGKQYIYDGVNPFEKKSDMRMGVKDITISSVYEEGGNVYVKGNNFTDSSFVYINGSKQTTKYIDTNTLEVESYDLSDQDKIRVAQLTITDFALGKTEDFIYSEQAEDTSSTESNKK